MPFLPLWVELYRESVRVVVDACGFSELEDAVRRRSGARRMVKRWAQSRLA